jgi:hypothetical protein
VQTTSRALGGISHPKRCVSNQTLRPYLPSRFTLPTNLFGPARAAKPPKNHTFCR